MGQGHRPRVRLGPSGVHLFHRASGLNVLFDEVSVAPELWSWAPRHVSIALTNECGLGCAHCFAPKHQASLNPGAVCEWIEELDAGGAAGVGFGGGEPTLYPYLVDVCRHAALNTGLAVSITTNGLHLAAALTERLTGYVHFMRISMDGVGRTYEAIRGRPFEVLITNIERLSGAIPFGINCVINRHTLPELDAVVELAADLGAKELLLLPEQASIGGMGIDDATADALAEWVRFYNGQLKISVSESGSEGLPCCRPMADETGLREYAHIDADGILKTSSFAAQGLAIDYHGVRASVLRLESLEEGGVCEGLE